VPSQGLDEGVGTLARLWRGFWSLSMAVEALEKGEEKERERRQLRVRVLEALIPC